MLNANINVTNGLWVSFLSTHHSMSNHTPIPNLKVAIIISICAYLTSRSMLRRTRRTLPLKSGKVTLSLKINKI